MQSSASTVKRTRRTFGSPVPVMRPTMAVIVAVVVVSARMPVAVLSVPGVVRVIVICELSPSSSMQARAVSSCRVSNVLMACPPLAATQPGWFRPRS